MVLRSRNKVSPDFNMSSMTDIVFLLLIFFMLTSTLVSPNALKLLLPNSKAKTLEKQTVSVSITKEIDFFINERKVTENNLERELKLLLENKQEAAIILHTDKTVDIEFVVKVMDIAYRNKYKIVLATTPN
ncbi:MAG TPA: biopolymer transporter ExbD [Flavobacteriales bacterium]|nr:biopolymer transporter ExbD [Flavobacteriales bacterium]HIL66809.1 biopolymer transporter ExbD [Flavobacteriales bacterium]|tara:strand:+ start:806 stop:1198 length:393 start_codon:yes stop_codon:yes gene_type:complete